MTKKTPEKFAKAIMMELASIHTFIEQVHACEVARLATAQGKSRQEISDTFTAERRKRLKELYANMLDFSEMKEDEEGTP